MLGSVNILCGFGRERSRVHQFAIAVNVVSAKETCGLRLIESLASHLALCRSSGSHRRIALGRGREVGSRSRLGVVSIRLQAHRNVPVTLNATVVVIERGPCQSVG